MVSIYIVSDALFLSFFKMKLLVAHLTLLNALPSVIWHGMGDTANSAGSVKKIRIIWTVFDAYHVIETHFKSKIGMRRMKQMIIDNTDNDYVLSLQIGDSKFNQRP